MRFSCALLRVIRFMIYINFPNSQDVKLLLAWATSLCTLSCQVSWSRPVVRAAHAASKQQARLCFAQVSPLHFQTHLHPPPPCDSHLADIPALNILSL